MDAKQRAKLKRTLGTLGRIVSEYQFMYTAADEDSFPGLIVEKKISALDILHLRRRAMMTDFVRGTVERLPDGRIAFQIEKGSPDSLSNFRFHLQGILKEQVPILTGAKIITAPE